MVSVRFAALVGVAAAFASAANAADMPELLPPVHVPPIEEAAGWYLRGDIGFSNQQVKDAVFNFGSLAAPSSVQTISKEFETGGIFGLGIGYQFNNWLRADVTGEYRTGSTFHGFEIVNGTIPEHNTLIKSEWVALANLYVDFGTWWSLTPFVGAGIGTSYVRLSGFTDTVNTIGANNFADDGEKWNFAWALHAGLAYKVTPGFTVELAYRYISLGDGITGSPIRGFNGTYQGAAYELKDITSHDVKFGVRWLLEPPQPAPPPVMLPPLMRRG
jgi:opacity protein-like surface antigen